ncbi:hypothetical protein V7119_26960, partial [Bacillus toyonensis]|uniref:hypothetical protein n=1 Tax=Bacillus toyonensis TaxID=155322 RepID=UPI002FFDAA56
CENKKQLFIQSTTIATGYDDPFSVIRNFVSNVFRHYSQYKYNMLIPKQPAHLLPKNGHDSAIYFNSLITFIFLDYLTATATLNKLNFLSITMLDRIVEHVMEAE